ncbi:MAG: molybdopterin-dependent oxidoreductase [Planctomycetaceae bacterium]|nr:molybdopterin-dependent oxidoreductase [Planctomycetaceae bacterium]
MSALNRSSRLPPGQQLVAPGKFPFVGEKSPAERDDPWTVTVAGCVEHEQTWSLDQLSELPQVERTIDIHCVTRWTKLDARFRGVRLSELLNVVQPTSAAKFVSLVARSPRAHSTSLALATVLELDALIALEYDGAPLATDHGGPVRVIVPERYFYKSLKWLERIELLSVDRLGYWEANAGYHNEADPWREQRFLAAKLTRQQMQQVLATRDFSGLDLLGIDARGHDLAGLQARSALLRNAWFDNVNLNGACFAGANLSGAHVRCADLRGANFRDGNLEGTDFAGADLRGTDFRGASLIAATFVDGDTRAIIDTTTLFDREIEEQLMPEQLAFVKKQRDVR